MHFLKILRLDRKWLLAAALMLLAALTLAATTLQAQTPFSIDQSLRFNDDDNAYLSRTPSSAGDRQTWTWSGWVKKSNPGVQISFFGVHTADTDTGFFNAAIDSNDQLKINGWDTTWRLSSALFRDPADWLHVVIAVDTTMATANERIKVYVDGVQLTAFDTLNNPSQNDELAWNQATRHVLGARETSASGETHHFDGYMSDIHFIDGQALSPTDFGETDDNGYWRPKEYSGSYGTNGFHLDFANSSDLGNDVSGNGNDWTANNLDATDQVIDTPTNAFATLNPLQLGTNSYYTLSDGNLLSTGGGSGTNRLAIGTMGVSSGKWYFEGTYVSNASNSAAIGIFNLDDARALPLYAAEAAEDDDYTYSLTANKVNKGSATSYGDTYAPGDVIGVAFDADAETLTFYKNGVSQGTAFTDVTDATFAPVVTAVSPTWRVNFGQNATSSLTYYPAAGGYFKYEPPTGFKALSTQNLPDPLIDVPSQFFDALTYTGNGSTQSITGLDFSPDFVWIKNRDTTNSHQIFDAIRGATKLLQTNNTAAEMTLSDRLTSFNSDGFSVGDAAAVNGSSNALISWNWNHSPTAGFDIQLYSGDGASHQDVSHNLGDTPAMIITKQRNSTDDWMVWHEDLTTVGYILKLNSNAAEDNTGNTTYGAPTSSYVRYKNNGTAADSLNQGGATYVSYLFAEKDGFSKFGSYTGNGSTDGPFVYTGFKPRWIMFKRTDSANSWSIWDTTRNPYNDTDLFVLAEATNAENSSPGMDILSNGFKFRTTGTGRNASGGTYIYAAFAEVPFKYSAASAAQGPGLTLTGNVDFLKGLSITNILSKGSGTFVIDHPQDPYNKMLIHSFVESPEVKNLYDGIATIDKNGEAVIELPEYFEALNTDFRYQFQALGIAMPNLHIKQEVRDSRFIIGGGVPGGRVSWQVTGRRHDPYIEANPVEVEVLKGPSKPVDIGECIHPPNCQ